MEKITVLLVDDHKMVTNALSYMINTHNDYTAIGEIPNSLDVLTIVREKRPAIVIIELSIAISKDFELTKGIHKYCPGAKIVWLSSHPIISYVKKMKAVGCVGYLTKNSSGEEFFKTLAEVYSGFKYICQEVRDLLSEATFENKGTEGFSALTARELIIISALKEGLSSKEIAVLHGISLKTVEVHRYHILKKLQMKNVASLINYINTNGL